MMGLSIATSAVVGQNIGGGHMQRAEHAARVAGWLAFLGFTGVGLLLIPAAAPLMRTLAPHQPDVVSEAVTFCYIFLPFLGVLALPQVLNGVFRGAGSTRQAMTISLVMQYVFQMPAAWVMALATPLGVLGVWWSYPIANVCAAALCIVWLLKGPWRRDLVHGAPAKA
jgi:Na+-driven multidrug efflux pump